MSDIAISVQSLSKRYRLGLKEQMPDTFVGTLTSWLKSPLANYRQLHKLRDFRDDPLDAEGHEIGATPEDVLYALRDVSFDIKKGEVVGIIGRNGAGKSTLLKILSRITEPTSGRVEVHGRVASLLEVGTGFHPELTGRENIYLNGTILGMRKAEIDRKFDEIVAFSEIERFLDTPVKRYSSGMYVRLAFAVAAHLEPEILIVDEVLAVGDAAFQKKCLGKMEAVSRREGRTVLFVSHNLQSIRQLCSTAVLMAGGRVQTTGPCARVLEVYHQALSGPLPTAVPPPPPELEDRAFATGVTVETLDGQHPPAFAVGQPWRVRVAFKVIRPQPNFVVAVGLISADGSPVQTVWLPPKDYAPGNYEAVFTQDRVVLEAGTYSLFVGLSQNDRALQQFEAARVDISGADALGYYQSTAGAGTVLNSMRTDLCAL